MIVSTGKLHPWGGRHPPDYLDNHQGFAFVCGNITRCFFEIPKSNSYWMEVSDKPQRGQWVEGEIKTDGGIHILWRADGGNWRPLCGSAEDFLRRHFKLSEKPTRLWCRLLYE